MSSFQFAATELGPITTLTRSIFDAVRCVAQTEKCNKSVCECQSLLNGNLSNEEIFITVKILVMAVANEVECIGILLENRVFDMTKFLLYMTRVLISNAINEVNFPVLLSHPYLVLSKDDFNVCAGLLFQHFKIHTIIDREYDFFVKEILSDPRFDPSLHIDIAIKRNSPLIKKLLNLGAIPKNEFRYCQWLVRSNLSLRNLGKHITKYLSNKTGVVATIFYNTLIYHAALNINERIILKYLHKFDPDYIIVMNGQYINVINGIIHPNDEYPFWGSFREYNNYNEILNILLAKILNDRIYYIRSTQYRCHSVCMNKYFLLMRQYIRSPNLDQYSKSETLFNIINSVVNEDGLIIYDNSDAHKSFYHYRNKLALIDSIKYLISTVKVNNFDEIQWSKYAKLLWNIYGRTLYQLNCLPEIILMIVKFNIRI